ncbi:MAG TPA: ABC transporter permease [Spirochaetota bacterium]|nr:ABC transporter permease [Spirochaetota bacterium]HPJ14303.1 ABC transporter permease [Spirochaetota bacterium]HPM33152.1 ABC transporter permease [Spirochaetota bacterium]HPY01640.1 ABC transporter permease [Spirochaetota bacterium]HQA53395.1 ABC transporter permease [Spirochaetota bacterium]
MILDSVISSYKVLRANRARSILTSCGIIIGIASVIMMIGLASSAQVAVKNKIFSYGKNGMSIIPRAGGKILLKRDIPELKKYRQFKYVSRVLTQSDVLIKYGNKSQITRIYGTDNDFLFLQGRKPLFGRMFTDDELVRGNKAVIIGDSVRIKFFGFSDPTGKIIFISNQPFRVIASLYRKGTSLTGEDFDNICVVPAKTSEFNLGFSPYSAVIYASSIDEKTFGEAVTLADSYFRGIHSLNAEDPSDFDIETNSKNLEIADNISRTLTYLLIAIASISLIVGGIGIMNIMLVSVNERTREIGIRMSIGAKKRDILTQFLTESVILCSFGGVLGILFGLTGYFFIAFYLNWAYVFSPLSIIISFSFAFAVGIFFGFYPAKKASDLNPIEALRME